MPVKLLTSGGGGVNLVPSSSIASDVTVAVPSKSGTTVLTDVADNIGIAATGANYITMSTNGSERMRIDSSGSLLVGKTSSSSAVASTALCSFGRTDMIVSGGVCSVMNRLTNTGTIIEFQYANGIVGTISTNGSSTSYNTSSDYRLKEDYQPVADAIERLNQLKPVNFAWKVDGSRCDGFLAHELQEVIPEAATGTKDEMRIEEYEVTHAIRDEEGNVITEAVMGEREVPIYQGIDQSKIVPLLTAALQEAVAKIESLTQRIEALEYTK